MDTVFDDLSRAISRPCRDVRAVVVVIALDLAGKLATGLAMAIGIAVGMALAR